MRKAAVHDSTERILKHVPKRVSADAEPAAVHDSTERILKHWNGGVMGIHQQAAVHDSTERILKHLSNLQRLTSFSSSSTRFDRANIETHLVEVFGGGQVMQQYTIRQSEY